ncbi:TPA: hypothetical protein J9283_005228 [Escherichia coli]|nr:hypothetical protein [Escherichia coli]HBA4558930.1 hypothetical protein [Escherichia coli]HBA4629958.1 hypothetical protein [Escherichia coli]HBA4631740.1 hypothetical protein [Escherichia coli]HBA4773248.1 hypothetical protein [Escherichia coli]
MKSALKKSVVSTSISLILASGMAAFAAHAADDVKLKATKTNVAFSDFTPTEYSTKGKPNIIVPRFYVSTSKSIIKALINMHSFEIQLSPIG